ncbi:MAG: cytochrome c biogenesis protein CcsA, partial [Betaproteobacteria bacterium]|nr:cytochrome c biogenesis protein CcsA [Betaproteobacteria bacterium]
MIAELGHFALILALVASLAQGILLLAGAARRDAAWLAAGRHASVVQPLLVSCAFAALAASFLANDFSVRVVAANSHSALPDAYRFAATWGGQEGSVLLWATALALWTLAFRFASQRLPMVLSCRALGILGFVSAGTLAVAIAGSSPFARLLPAPAEGRDLNPFLQDPGMLLHPPLVFAGYAGFAVVFAIALGALLGGRLDAAWARGSRPWALVAWSALTLGIGAGSHWAYRELGWEGWWSWDPVQNAALMPWLAGAALLHSLAVAEKRGLFRRWTVLLAVLAFSLALLGIVLARSGAASSVHDFASDPRGGRAMLAFLAVVVAASVTVAASRPRVVDGEGRWEMISREAAIAAGNAVLLTTVGAVLLGTLYPFVAATLGSGHLTVGPSYFASVFLPLVLPGLALLGPAPRLRWGSESAREAMQDAIRPAVAATVAAAVAVLVVDRPTAWLAIGIFLAAWIAMHAAEAVAYRSHARVAGGAWRAMAGAPASFHAMHCAHLGVAVL